ncbi:hypothetical protein [Streptomyces agglomeratus]|uniref:hypothetical protein n=1 Tax=Streptomyces agglomeratus TaxID=285458 RepID=UPI00114CB3F5|nr:hypothetical protein [Streptomyces agglomeratus]
MQENEFSDGFQQDLEQARIRKAAAADEIANVAKFHLPRFHDRDDGDNGYVNGALARRAITPHKRQVLASSPSSADLDVWAAFNYVIVYNQKTDGSFLVYMLIHNNQLGHYKTTGLWNW